MGRVWRAVHRSGVPAALKIISPDAEEGLDPAAGLQAEIRAVAALEHPNIVPVYDAGVLGPEHEGMSGGRLVQGSPWLAMELAQGSVHDLTERMDWPLLLRILLQTLDGLAHAHARGVIHRDLKPANVLYSRATGNLRVLVADFGMAWAWRRSGPPVDGGTAAYSSPEQLLGQLSEQGPWSDLYSLGCTAFRLITGRRPYRGQTFEELQRAHVFGDQPKLQPRFAVPEGLATWIEGMMAKDPRMRFQRAADAAWSLVQLPAVAQSDAIDIEDEVETVSVLRSGRARARTLPVEAWAELLEDCPEPASDPAAVRPPVPEAWARPPRAKVALRGRGLGLFGLAAPPMVAREAERDQLWTGLAHGDELQVAVVSGGYGFGKSRLGAWLCERAHEVGAAEVFRGRFRPEISATQGLAAMVEEHLRTHGMTGSEVHAHLTQMSRLDAEGVPDPARVARLLRPNDELLDQEPLGVAARVALAWQIMQRRLHGRRILVWLDDAHLGSEAVELLAHLATHAATVPGLILVTVREDVPPVFEARLTELTSTLPTFRTALEPLPRAASVTLVKGMLPVPDALAERIVTAAGGVPLATVRFVSDLVEHGQLKGDPQGVEVDPRVPVPDSLGSLYAGALRRLEVLGEHGREVLEVAAVLGVTVALPEWREACQLLELMLDPQQLAAMATRDFVRPERGGGRYTFGQTLLREALLDALVREDRAQSIHLACGRVLEARGDARAAKAGEHLEAAGQYLRAAAAYLRGMRWLASWDRERALELGTKWYATLGKVAPQGDHRWADGMQVLVQLLGVQGGDAHRAATEALLQRGRGDPQAEALALIELAHADLRAQELGRAAARAELAWHRARETSLRPAAAAVRAEVRRRRGELDQAEALLRDALKVDRDAAPLVLSLARVLSDDGRAGEALMLLDGWADRVTRDHAPMMRARLHRARGEALLALNQPRAALMSLEEACGLRDRAGFDWPELDLDHAAALVATGDQNSAVVVLDELLDRLDDVREARLGTSALTLRALIAADVGEWPMVESCLDTLEDMPGPGRSVPSLARLDKVADLAEAADQVALARRARRLRDLSLPG